MIPLPVVNSENCLCVIVTFNPDAIICERLKKLKKIFQHVLIVDNSCSVKNIGELRAYVDELNVSIIHNSSNLGLGAALNQGWDVALKLDLQWCAFFDQDTDVYPSFLNSLQICMQEIEYEGGIIGSNYKDKHAHEARFKNECSSKVNYKGVKTVITSGSVISMNLYKKIGGFREDYFIDSIDHEYCLRARSFCYKVLLSLPVTMEHSLGDTRRGRGVFKSFPEHDPQRKFYIARNTITTVKMYHSFDKVWCLKQVARLISEFVCVILFESRKKEKTLASIKGLLYGFSGRMDAWSQE